MKIGVLDHMGYGNLGDAATQEALISNIKERMPDVDIVGFSLNPDDTRKRHNIPCYSITHWHPGLAQPELASTNGRNLRSRLKSRIRMLPVISALALGTQSLIRELAHLTRSFIVVRSLDRLIIAGGGQLSELWRGPWSHPYNIFKFSVLAKLARKQLIFLNVGAGPLNRNLSKAFVRCSVSLADYVSLRDVQSQTLIQGIGVKRKTEVFPDSAYSLDISTYKRSNEAVVSRPLVGLNPIGFCDPRIWPKEDAYAYSTYLDNLAAFSLWLLSRKYRLNVFSGEVSVDVFAIEDLKGRLRYSISAEEIDEIFTPPPANVNDLLAAMSRFDFVVTSKFHGVVFSHLLAKPVIALSYHNKIDDLMRTVGHGRHCLKIESIDQECLKEAFIGMVEDAQRLKAQFCQTTDLYAEALKGQLDELFLPEKPALRANELKVEGEGAVLGDSA